MGPSGAYFFVKSPLIEAIRPLCRRIVDRVETISLAIPHKECHVLKELLQGRSIAERGIHITRRRHSIGPNETVSPGCHAMGSVPAAKRLKFVIPDETETSTF